MIGSRLPKAATIFVLGTEERTVETVSVVRAKISHAEGPNMGGLSR
jgi:hypothetical protein